MTLLLTEYQREVLRMHIDPVQGSAYWIERLGTLPELAKVETLNALCRLLGPMDVAAMRLRPMADFLSLEARQARLSLTLGETGGATGQAIGTAYLPQEFQQAFVEPFALAAQHVTFPRGENWLFVGPSGPHVIGKVAKHLARSVDSAEPFAVDFDPRWARKLPEDSMARNRYAQHVCEQALCIIQREQIGVLFVTPSLLQILAEQMSAAQREQIQGVHYGGQRLDPVTLQRFQTEVFPNAVHLSGYGNTLFGCCLELDRSVGRTPCYFPFGERVVLHPDLSADCDVDLTSANLPSESRVFFSRFDRSTLIINFAERDVADFVPREIPGNRGQETNSITLNSYPVPACLPDGFANVGVSDPRPAKENESAVTPGLY